MFFRCSYTVRLRIQLEASQSVPLAMPAPGVHVALQGLPDSDQPTNALPLRQLCVVTEQTDTLLHSCFGQPAQRVLRSFGDLTPECQALVSGLADRLDEYARRSLRLLRWRFGIEGPQFLGSLAAAWNGQLTVKSGMIFLAEYRVLHVASISLR
jgi:hypothetical protein